MRPLNLILIVTVDGDHFSDPVDILHALGDDLTFDCEHTMKTALLTVRRWVSSPDGKLQAIPELDPEINDCQPDR